MEQAVEVSNLTKLYPRVKAVDGVSFEIAKGEIFGLLGPNGAGKTTIIRMLLTLIKPTNGTIKILGFDAGKSPDNIRQLAGYVPQDVSVDGELTGYENILMYSKIYGIPSKIRRERIKEALDLLNLTDRANSMVNTYSGGMMRRTEIAQALVNRPKILFMDEPSIGLDPSAKRVIWDLIRKLRDEFDTTIFINTHDMVEADSLCDRLGIMDKGKLVVTGHPDQLKDSVGGDIITISSGSPDCEQRLKDLNYQIINKSNTGYFELLVSKGEQIIPLLLYQLKTGGIDVDSVSLKKPALDDVFLKYTGAMLEESSNWTQTRRTRQTFRRLTR